MTVRVEGLHPYQMAKVFSPTKTCIGASSEKSSRYRDGISYQNLVGVVAAVHDAGGEGC